MTLLNNIITDIENDASQAKIIFFWGNSLQNMQCGIFISTVKIQLVDLGRDKVQNKEFLVHHVL